jgi:hypothetical protein
VLKSDDATAALPVKVPLIVKLSLSAPETLLGIRTASRKSAVPVSGLFLNPKVGGLVLVGVMLPLLVQAGVGAVQNTCNASAEAAPGIKAKVKEAANANPARLRKFPFPLPMASSP